MDERQSYVSELRRDLAEWNTGLDRIEARARAARPQGPEAEKDLALIERLRADLEQLSARLDAVSEAPEEQWRDRSEDSERARSRFRASFAEAVSLWPPD